MLGARGISVGMYLVVFVIHPVLHPLPGIAGHIITTIGALAFREAAYRRSMGKAIPGVAKVADGRMVRYLAKFLDFDRVHVLDFHVATFDVSPLFVFMHIFIL